MQNKKNYGFTLIELLVVSTIMIILAGIGIASFTEAAKSARDARRKTDMETVRQALVLYKAQNVGYPASGGDLAASFNVVMTNFLASASNSYISTPTPTDPRNATNDGSALYYYSYYSASGSSFCVCADVENIKNGNGAGRDCSAFTTTGEYYCAKQP